MTIARAVFSPPFPASAPHTRAPQRKKKRKRKGKDNKKYPKKTHLQSDHGILHVQPRIDRQSLRNRQQRVRKRLHSQLGPPLGDTLLRLVDEVLMRGDFERSGTGDEGAVFERVLDGAETVPDRVRDLGDGVRVRTCTCAFV